MASNQGSLATWISEMARRLPDLSPAALASLVAGMTTKEVEAAVGCYHRPNVFQGRRYYVWIGSGGMLRAFFNGPNGTLSTAILDVPEEQRVLNLNGNLRRRIKNCTINRVWYCIACRKRYRGSALPPLACPICHEACEHVALGIAVPPPKRVKLWDRFWVKYKAERSLVDAYALGQLRENVKLEILGMDLKGKPPSKRQRRQGNE
jgi:hypothetical protein